MNYDPKLREAMNEISALMKKYDIGGYVTLVSPTHSEFQFVLDPSWSAIRIEDGEKIRIRVKQAELGVDGAIRKLEETVHLVCSVGDLSARAHEGAKTIEKLISEYIEIERFSNGPFPVYSN